MFKVFCHFDFHIAYLRQQQNLRQEMAVHGSVANPFLLSAEAQMFHNHTEIALRVSGDTHGE